MADISKEDLKTEIFGILKGADLAEMSTKKVRTQIEKKLECSLLSRKKEIDELVMSFVNGQENDNEDDSEEESEEEKPKKKAPAKAKPAKKTPTKRKKNESSAESDADSDAPRPKSAKKEKAKKKKSGEDDDWKANGKPKKAAGPKKGNGFTRPYRLSADLANLMGAESLPRHEVVKKVWVIIKERNLYDPKNKQFAICDPELFKVMGVKRFRTFGMLKYLKDHFLLD